MPGRTLDADIVVVGGGPVGLLTALLCAEAGMSVVVVEAQATLPTDLRATSFHPPTLDLLDKIGFAETLIARGIKCPNWQIRIHPSGEHVVFEVAMIADETAHPFRLQCEQWKLSEALLERLGAQPRADLRRCVRVVAIAQNEECVTVTTDGGETITAGFVVGADGISSLVRDEIGIGFPGETFPETTLVVTTPFRFEDHLDGLANVTSCWTRDSHVAFLRLPDCWRLALYPDENRSIEEQSNPDAVEALLQDLVPQASRYEVLRVWPYRVQQRSAATFVSGRVALAGDAAHVNSPAGGLGLNTGIHDAFALAEAFADIHRSGAPAAERLARYDAQRRPIAEAILRQAETNRNRMRQKSIEAQRETLAGLQAIADDPEQHRAFVLRASMIEALRRHDPDRLFRKS